MSKVEYKDVPVYFAHEDGATVPTAVQTAIEAGDSTVTSNYKIADENVKSWADNKFQTK